MRRALSLSLLLLVVSLLFLSCGSNSGGGPVPGLNFRALVSQDVNAGGISAGLQVIDAEKDLRALVAPISAGATPGMLVETPNLNFTLAFSAQGNTLAFVSNSTQSTSGQLTLPGLTESIVVAPDSLTAYAAVPTAPVVNQSPGVIEVISLSTGAATAQISCPPGVQNPPTCIYLDPLDQGLNQPYRYLSISNSGNRLLAFSQGVDSVANKIAVITPSNIGTQNPVVTVVPGFDHPVAAFFSPDDNTAVVINCGAECGGAQASVQILDLTNTQCAPFGVCPAVPVPAASVALVSGTTMYLAGSYVNPSPTDPCPGQTVFSTTCGSLSILDLPSMTVTNSGIAITNGDHNRIALGADNQLFVGAHNCTEIAGVSGCLSIYNTQTGAVVIPPANGDVTGIQPIANRHVVYLIQGGELQMYDTTTGKLQATQINIIGEAVDVKTIDF